MNDVLGQAIFDYYHNQPQSKLWIHNTYGTKEEMPVEIYFRDVEEMPDLELIAMQHCFGKVLDIGAGAGSHTIHLQEKGIDVTALEISPKAAKTMTLRGVKNVLNADIYSVSSGSYDTLLLLMNGIGLTSSITGLQQFLKAAKKLIKPGGQVLFDSSDVSYLFDGKIPQLEKYYGEIQYQYEYKKLKTEWFTWLYIDKHTLTSIAAEIGWKTEVLAEDELDQYLAKLILK